MIFFVAELISAPEKVMATMSCVRCPHCQIFQNVEDTSPGELWRCRSCGREFPLSAAGHDVSAVPTEHLPEKASETFAFLPDENLPSRQRNVQPRRKELPDAEGGPTWVPFRFGFRLVVSLSFVSLGLLFLFLRSHGYFRHFEQRSLAVAIAALVGGIAFLFVPGYYRHTAAWDRWSNLPEPVRRRAGRRGLWRSLIISLPVLACVFGGWCVLTMVYLLGFAPIPAGVGLFLYGLVVSTVGVLWLRRICIRDDVWEVWMTHRQRWFHTGYYVRQFPERAARPFWLGLAGLLLFFASFVLVMMAEHKL
jgi:hypothetical protein